MQGFPNISAGFLAALRLRSRSLIETAEFYLSSETTLEPANAVKVFTAVTNANITAGSGTMDIAAYEREMISRSDIQRHYGKQFNSVTIQFGNASRAVSEWALTTQVEGMRLVVRVMDRTGPLDHGNMVVLFVGRCEKPDGFDRERGSVAAKQDLGSVEAEIPARDYQARCPLRFKGEECLGTELLAAKSPTYQAALTCNKSYGQCVAYANEEFFQGMRLVQIQGSFIHRPHESFFQKLIGVLTPGTGTRRRVVGNSTHAGDAMGKVRPVVLGRWQMPGTPLQYQDQGSNINFDMGFCHGPIHDFVNTKNLTTAFGDVIGLVKHYGRYGGEADQGVSVIFPTLGYLSRLAHLEGYVTGSETGTEDASPEIVSLIAGVKTKTSIAHNRSGLGRLDSPSTYFLAEWTDDPVALARWVLTDPALLALPEAFFNDTDSAHASAHCTQVVRDQSNAERLLLPNSQTGVVGVDYKRYASTGLVSPKTWNFASRFSLPSGTWDVEAVPEFFDPDAPPTQAMLGTTTVYRLRYRFNRAVTERKKAIDFLYDELYPSARLHHIFDATGKLVIKSDKLPDSSLLRAASSIGATAIDIENAWPWINVSLSHPLPRQGKVLIGVGTATAEARTVASAEWSTAGNLITLGGVGVTASGATLTGGTSSVQASGTLTRTGAFTPGAVLTATIDGVSSTYTCQAGESGYTAANSLAAAINANPITGRYVEATVVVGSSVIDLVSVQGRLLFTPGLEAAHSIGEETIRVMMSFADRARVYADVTASNIIDGSFKWPLTGRTSSKNQIKATYTEANKDFAEQPLVLNDYEHQDYIGKVNPETLDLLGVDNYHQAYRICANRLAVLRDGRFFAEWQSDGEALLLDEGDMVCVSHPSGGTLGFRCVALKLEQISISSFKDGYKVSLQGRKYSLSQYSDEVEPVTMQFTSARENYLAAPPDITFNLVDFPPGGLVQSTDGAGGITSIRGGAVFGAYPYGQVAKVAVQRPGSVAWEQVAIITPDANSEAVFEFVASLAGPYTVRLEVCSLDAVCNETFAYAVITVGLGANQGRYAVPMLQLSGAGTVSSVGTGTYNIPMTSITSSGIGGILGGGTFNVP